MDILSSLSSRSLNCNHVYGYDQMITIDSALVESRLLVLCRLQWRNPFSFDSKGRKRGCAELTRVHLHLNT